MATTPTTSADMGDFIQEASGVRRDVSRLPQPMQRIIRLIRRPYLRGQLVKIITDAVEELAKADGALVSTYLELDRLQVILPEDRRQDYLGQLVTRPGFLSALHREARRIVRDQNVMKQVFPEKGLHLLEKLPESGVLTVRGSNRFNRIEAMFETMPVGLAAAIGNWIVETTTSTIQEDIGLDEAEKVITVLAWHCGIAGVLALTLDFLKPHNGRFGVTEVDVYRDLRDRQDSAWWTGSHGIDLNDGEKRTPVVARLHHVPDKKFEFVVLDMPPPGDPGASNLRNRWKTEDERQLHDPGRLSVRAWRKTLRGYLRQLPSHLERGGRAVLVLPESVRVPRGYRHEEGLLLGVDDCLTQVGLETVRDLQVKEESPLPQPFVGSSRPDRRLLIVQRTS